VKVDKILWQGRGDSTSRVLEKMPLSPCLGLVGSCNRDDQIKMYRLDSVRAVYLYNSLALNR
jgi:hypothetical protein